MKDEKLYELLNQMTLEEKIGQLIQVAGEVFLMDNIDIVTGPLKELELSEQMLYNVGSILNIVGTEKVLEHSKRSRLVMIFEKLSALIAEQFNVDPDTITMDTSFEDDLNADSVDIVDLSMALEEEFGIEELGEAEATSITTVGDLVRLIQSKID